MIGGPICRQSIRETEPEPKSTKKDEKAPKPHQVKGILFHFILFYFISFLLLLVSQFLCSFFSGKAKVVLAKKHLQQLDRCLATLQDIDGKKLGVAYDKFFFFFFFFFFCFVLFCFVLFCFVSFCFVLFCFVLFCFVLFCFVLFCFVLFCFGLVWFGLVWFGLVWFGLVWFGLVWFGLNF